MSQGISRDDVAHVAKLARLTLSDQELEEFTQQLANILDHANDLSTLAAGDVLPTAHPFGLTNVVRRDDVIPSLEPRDVLAGAPDAEDGRFAVPRIVGEAP